MIEQLIKEIKFSLENNQYMAALTMSLLLPDICGKAEFPDAKNRERYVEWYDKYIGQYEKCKDEIFDHECHVPNLTGEIVYSLRCSVLHQGAPTINKSKCKIDHFTIMVQKYVAPDIHKGDVVVHKIFGTGTITWIDKTGKHIRVNFNAGEKTFIFPDAFKAGFLKMSVVAEL